MPSFLPGNNTAAGHPARCGGTVLTPGSAAPVQPCLHASRRPRYPGCGAAPV